MYKIYGMCNIYLLTAVGEFARLPYLWWSSRGWNFLSRTPAERRRLRLHWLVNPHMLLTPHGVFFVVVASGCYECAIFDIPTEDRVRIRIYSIRVRTWYILYLVYSCSSGPFIVPLCATGKNRRYIQRQPALLRIGEHIGFSVETENRAKRFHRRSYSREPAL